MEKYTIVLTKDKFQEWRAQAESNSSKSIEVHGITLTLEMFNHLMDEYPSHYHEQLGDLLTKECRARSFIPLKTNKWYDTPSEFEYDPRPDLVYHNEPTSVKIKNRLKRVGKRFYSNDNIAEYIEEGELELLIDEAAEKFKGVLDSLVIDQENDPNAKGTAKRLAKMYINELFEGRFTKEPEATAFPNTGGNAYKGMLVVRSELKSVCSHHWQPVTGVAYIGIIPGDKVIGLSKYTRIAQHCARRGTLQEELCNDIANAIQKATGSNDVAVYCEMKHGCCENRGIRASNSMTQTTVLKGEFHNADVKKEFFDNIQLQKSPTFGCN